MTPKGWIFATFIILFGALCVVFAARTDMGVQRMTPGVRAVDSGDHKTDNIETRNLQREVNAEHPVHSDDVGLISPLVNSPVQHLSREYSRDSMNILAAFPEVGQNMIRSPREKIDRLLTDLNYDGISKYTVRH